MLITRVLNKAEYYLSVYYKAYNNDILNTLERSDMGFKIELAMWVVQLVQTT
jgi:hypothetical protein